MLILRRDRICNAQTALPEFMEVLECCTLQLRLGSRCQYAIRYVCVYFENVSFAGSWEPESSLFA